MSKATITGHYILADTYTVEFERSAYYRIEILRLETGQPIEETRNIAEVYMLCWPNGQMAGFGKGQRLDTQFRQSWMFLDDFPLISGSSVEEVHHAVLKQLETYTVAYLSEYKTGLKRGRPSH